MHFEGAEEPGGALPVRLAAPHEIGVERLYLLMRQGRGDVELIMKDQNVLYILRILYEEGVDEELGLQKLFFINWTVEEALEF